MKNEAVVEECEALPRSHRIQKRRDFLRAYEDGKKTFGRYVVVFEIANEQGHPRLGITVTRKLGNASARNRAKRWVREVYRRNREAIFDDFSMDLVVNVKPVARDAEFAAFSEDLVRTLDRVSRSRITTE